MQQLSKINFDKLLERADNVYSVEGQLFVIIKEKTYIGRNLEESTIQYALDKFFEKLSFEIETNFGRAKTNKECDSAVEMLYAHRSVEHIANFVGISPYRVRSIIYRLVLQGRLKRKKKYKTKWSDFIRKNHKSMSKEELSEATGLHFTTIERAIKTILNEEE
ncbi:MAG: hypothetical protein ACRCYT_01360 [Cetobacterium sp.]